MPSITRKLLERTENVRILYALHQEVLRDLVKSGAPLEPGCEMVFDKAALEIPIPTFTIDLSKFGPKWADAMKTLLLFPAIGNRKERLQLFRGLLEEFYLTASAALLANIRSMMRADNWERVKTFLTKPFACALLLGDCDLPAACSGRTCRKLRLLPHARLTSFRISSRPCARSRGCPKSS